jgi:serine/threonine protein kinase
VTLTTPGRLVVGRYRLLTQIGGGGMGTVWLARDERLGRQVAIKQVLPPVGADAREAARQRERALREGRIAARLSNPHAISVYDVAVEADEPWLVMEYLPSRSLSAVLTEDGLLRVDQVAQVGAQVADALAATHAAGIVHRDVKPANVLIGRGDNVEGLVKITDFGISHASGDFTLTQTGQITGTPAFLAPEVAQGEEPQPPSDVFSLGATLYTCLEGEPPFGMGSNALQLLHKVAGGGFRPPEHAGSLTRPLLRMLAADPARRPAMEQVRDELAKLAAGRDGDTTTVLMARTDLRSPPRRAGTAQMSSQRPPAPTPVPPIPPPIAAAVAPQNSPRPPTQEPARAPSSEPSPDPVPAPAPAAAAAAARSQAEPVRGRRRSRRLLTLLVSGALVVAAAVAAGIVLLGRDDGGAGSTAQGGTSQGDTSQGGTSQGGTSQGGTSQSASRGTASSPATGSSSESSAPSSSAPAATSGNGSAAAGAPTADDVRSAITGYYGLLPDDAAQAYELTGPTLRAAESRDNYIAFWNRFSEVRLGPVSATDGRLVATGRVTYVENGSPKVEQHTFTLIRGDDGRLLIDSDRQS